MENFNTVPSQGKYGDSIAVVNENFMLAQQEMEMLRQIYNSMSQSQPIPVTTLPATGEAGKIYRLAGTNSYADYMYAESDLTTPIKMAEYDNAIDNEPTPDSNNLVKSGGVAASVVFDISAYHATGGTLAKYADLAAALDGGNNIPASARKGGMSIKYVQSSDNKYVQYRLMSDTFSTTESDWQGVDDEPTNGSDNLVKSGSVASVINQGVFKYTGLSDILALRFNGVANSFYSVKFNRTDWATSYTGTSTILGIFIKYLDIPTEVRVVKVSAGSTPKSEYIIATDSNPVEYIRFSLRDTEHIDVGYSITDITNAEKPKTTNIKQCILQFGGIGSTANDGKLNPVNTISTSDFHLKRHAMRTPHYIDVRNLDTLDFMLDDVGNIETFNIVGYNSTFNRIESAYRTYTVTTDWTEGNWFTTDVHGYDYVRIILLPPSGETLHMCNMYVKDISYNDFIKEIRRGTGYIGLSIPVNVVNPNSCDNTSNSVQDSEDVYVDYGVLALPESYTNIGKKTRMIIYCHGAAVNYATNTSSFNSGDIDPTYWLSEGYAVMDMEGNPFNNEDEHFGIPQAAQCYENAYKWILETYNIENAVFVGGRSMGGLMAVELLRTEIPVVACCPNVMAINPVWNWNYMNAARRGFCATHMGFLNQPTWTSASPLPSDQLQSLSDNFDKLVSCSTMWALICDLPSKSVLLSVNAGRNVAESPEEEAIYANLHALVKCPVKIFSNEEDDTVMPKRNAHLFYRVLKNAGQIVEMRKFFVSGTGINAHHYELSTPLQTTITNTFGETITTSVVYIEMLQFWRRYEQGN